MNATVQVPKVKLNDGREMPALALGTWLGLTDLGMIRPTSNEVEQAVRWALDAGYTHIDTAWIYRIEDQVGRALKGVPREKVFVTTKLWNTFHARDAVVPALRESLRSLQLDYVDLYLIHSPIGHFIRDRLLRCEELNLERAMQICQTEVIAQEGEQQICSTSGNVTYVDSVKIRSCNQEAKRGWRSRL
ncbi:unnamed protein product [Euphydryas editha]|uniref:NADP-dependent oxidoreductase domain-containing protein n=1 Tax=Euphydryas editha TaxID=104508 RepID=A0AAU9TF21_EUPED|nr:unnamed protein product [Euphydryas editha]